MARRLLRPFRGLLGRLSRTPAMFLRGLLVRLRLLGAAPGLLLVRR